MTVKVILPDGKELLNITPQELNNYKMYKSGDLDQSPSINSDAMKKTYEEKILQENLTFINDLINNKYGFARINRKANLNFVKAKDEEYSDLMIAFNTAVSGLKLIVDDETTAKSKVLEAIAIWKKALETSDLSNKKARINTDVTISIYFNLLESFFAIGDANSGFLVIQKMNTLNLSTKERKLKDDYENSYNDLKKRISLNN
jgi:hypothetical protein